LASLTLGYHSLKLKMPDIFELGFSATARKDLTLSMLRPYLCSTDADGKAKDR